jgi:hypothetical protein
MGDHGQRLASIDRRTRRDTGAQVSSAAFVEEHLPSLLERHGDVLGDTMSRLQLRPLAFNITTAVPAADAAFTLDLGADGPVARPGIVDGAMVLDLDAGQFSDFAQDQRSLNSFSVARDVRMHNTNGAMVLDWDVAWRSLFDGWPAHVPGSVDFAAADGSPLDLERAFGPDDDPAEIARFFREAGFLRLRGWLDPADMATIAADMDRALPLYSPEDGRSWWATLSNGESRCVRMLHFVEHSPTTAAILGGSAWERLRSVVGGSDSLAAPVVSGNVIEALVKPLGVTQGISDIPWHRDCSLGRHSHMCCNVTVGVSVTDGGADRGQLRALAGSHRANVPAVGVRPDLDLPIVPLPTEAGDLTVHLSCTLHEATPPTATERKVMYTGFRLPDLPTTGTPTSTSDAAARAAWARRNQAHKLQSQPPSPFSAT